MCDKTIYVFNFIAILGTGLIAGVFLAFSSFIMAAFGKLPTANGIAAMQMINITVINPFFMAILFGTAVICFALAMMELRSGIDKNSQFIFVGALLYLFGTIGMTLAFNVPLNEDLAHLDAANPQNATLWLNYLQNWTFWNSMRGFAACVSSAAYVLAICTRI
jgi:uncharacterized membrane protein